MGASYFLDDAGLGGITGVMSWRYERDEMCIRVHIFSIPGWTDALIGRAVIDDFGYLVRVD